MLRRRGSSLLNISALSALLTSFSQPDHTLNHSGRYDKISSFSRDHNIFYGTYEIPAERGGMDLYVDGGYENFWGTNITISNGVTAVPEPSTYAAVSGLGALAAVYARRRLSRVTPKG